MHIYSYVLKLVEVSVASSARFLGISTFAYFIRVPDLTLIAEHLVQKHLGKLIKTQSHNLRRLV